MTGQGSSSLVDLTRATVANDQVHQAITIAFTEHPFTVEMKGHDERVMVSLAGALSIIVENVPPGPDRTVAIRKIREAYSNCHSAIMHDGRF
jgi:hypothetical protein